MKTKILKSVFVLLLLNVQIINGAFESLDITPTQTSGVNLGELSMIEFVIFMLGTLQLSVLYAVGALPFEFDLGEVMNDFFGEEEEEINEIGDNDINTSKIGRYTKKKNVKHRKKTRYRKSATMETSTYLLDCPLQFVCEVDAWANRDHSDSFLEGLLASWFRDPEHTWTHPNAKLYSGTGSCREMYPCPFNVQDAIGISIPGSNSTVPASHNERDVDDTVYMSFTDGEGTSGNDLYTHSGRNLIRKSDKSPDGTRGLGSY